MTVQGNVYRYDGAYIPLLQTKQSYVPLYIHGAEDMQRATIRGSSASQQQKLCIPIDIGTAIAQTNPYGLTFPCLNRCAYSTFQMFTTRKSRRINFTINQDSKK